MREILIHKFKFCYFNLQVQINLDATTKVISNLERTAKMVSPTSTSTSPVNVTETRLLSNSYQVSRLNICTPPQTELKANVSREEKRFECPVTTTQFPHASKHVSSTTGADEEEEIDVERIDERENSDPMWRPWQHLRLMFFFITSYWFAN